MSIPRITFHPVPGTTSEEARQIRARAWAFVFECWRARQEDGPATVPNDRKGSKNAPATQSIRE